MADDPVPAPQAHTRRLDFLPRVVWLSPLDAVIVKARKNNRSA